MPQTHTTTATRYRDDPEAYRYDINGFNPESHGVANQQSVNGYKVSKHRGNGHGKGPR